MPGTKKSIKKYRDVLIGAGVLLGILTVTVILPALKARKRTNSLEKDPNLGTGGPCPGNVEILPMSDSYLPGLLDQGSPMKVTWNWYACHVPEKGQIALVRISKDMPPKAKVIRATAGDSIQIQKDKSGMRWTLAINGIQQLDWQGSPYVFGGQVQPPLGRYIEMKGATLGPQDVLVLSTRAPGEMDSGLFGVFGVSDLVAQVERE